jgi:DNA-binding MarR family transcriptional regulator
VRPASLHLRNVVALNGSFEHGLARELSVNATDLSAMEHLMKDGPMSQGELARRLGITAASVSASVDRLEGLGHASRSPNPEDRRGVLVGASTQSTKRAMGVILPMVYAVDHVLDDFTPEEQEVITKYLERVSDQYRQHTTRLANDPRVEQKLPLP